MKCISKIKSNSTFRYDYIQVGMNMSHLPIEIILMTANKILYLEKNPNAYQDFINGASINKKILVDLYDPDEYLNTL